MTIVEGAVLLYGLDSNGALVPLLLGTDGKLSSDDPTAYSAQLAADVSMPTANTFYDGPSVSLPAGTYIGFASLVAVGAAGGVSSVTAKVWDGSTVVGSGEQVNDAGGRQVGISIVTSKFTISTTTTYKLSATCSGATATLKAAAVNNGAGNNATTLCFIKVA